jgi:hypothetical protein
MRGARTVGKDERHDVPAAYAGNDAEVNEEERGSDQPVHVARNEKLPAVGCNNPAAARRHRKVGDGGNAGYESGREEHTASSLALSSVDSDEQGDAREDDEDKLEQSLTEGGSHVNGLATVNIELSTLAHEHGGHLKERKSENTKKRDSTGISSSDLSHCMLLGFLNKPPGVSSNH